MKHNFQRSDRYLDLLRHGKLKLPKPISSGDLVLLGLVLLGLWGSVVNDYMILSGLNTLLLVCCCLNIWARRFVSSRLIQHINNVDKIKAIISTPSMVQDGDNLVVVSVWPSEDLVARVSTMNTMLDNVQKDREKAVR